MKNIVAKVKTRSIVGINAQPVSVEVHLSYSAPAFTIVGLAQVAVKESKDRVRSAILTSNFEFPCRRITVNLAPADIPKIGSGFDLPIAIGILVASGQISDQFLKNHEFIGELALDGKISSVPGIIPTILATYKKQHTLIIPADNQQEASIVNRDNVFIANSLKETCNYLNNNIALNKITHLHKESNADNNLDWSEIKGQQHAKHAMEIAAFGGHSVLLSGPPGSGKTMLASRFTTLLPLLNEDKALEYAAILSIKGKITDYTKWRQPAFRSPHHTASSAALVGGGNPPMPGEVSLAHNGVLFLDELPEFNRIVLETLREPLESGSICISRASNQVEFPAKFQFLAAMNPCPCGNFTNPDENCTCTPSSINRYLAKISGPLLDRIDMHVALQALAREDLLKNPPKSTNLSESIREKTTKIHNLQLERQGKLNANLSVRECNEFITLSDVEHNFLNKALTNLKLSARSFHRILKVARTIADTEHKSVINTNHLTKALSFRHIIKKL